MSFNRKAGSAIVVTTTLLVIVVITVGGCRNEFKIVDGNLYWVAPIVRTKVLVDEWYDPAFLEKHYTTVDGQVHLKDPATGKTYPTKRCFQDGFEEADHLRDFIGLERGWTSFTLNSYNQLHHPSLPCFDT